MPARARYGTTVQHGARNDAAKIAAHAKAHRSRARRSVAVVLSSGRPARSESDRPSDLIRTHVEELRVDRRASRCTGEPIASRDLLPRIYENREFAPAWNTLAPVDALLEMIDAELPRRARPERLPRGRAARRPRSCSDRSRRAARRPSAPTFDILLTDSIIRLGYHLRFGKVDPTRSIRTGTRAARCVGEDAAVTIQKAIDAPSLREFAARVIPRVFLYERFKTALAEYRAIEANGGWPSVPAGPTLTPGSSDERVPALAARLAVTGDLPPGARRRRNAVRRAARRRPSGGFRRGTASRPTAPSAPRRSRRSTCPLPRASSSYARISSALGGCFYDPESEFLVVNVAGFQLYLVRRGEVVWRTRVQVGQPVSADADLSRPR